MPAYLNVDLMTSREIRCIRLAMKSALSALDGLPASDDTIDVVNELVREVDGPRDMALHFARAAALIALSMASDGALAGSALRLNVLTLEAAEDVVAEREFDDGLHCWQFRDPQDALDALEEDCKICTNSDPNMEDT